MSKNVSSDAFHPTDADNQETLQRGPSFWVSLLTLVVLLLAFLIAIGPIIVRGYNTCMSSQNGSIPSCVVYGVQSLGNPATPGPSTGFSNSPFEGGPGE
ncbi:MAG TPA: hypothetical protein VKQ72_19440 [Aggregatilineales bacterium]|nr:hypothetical protein [Aggregatilineales bacterium]